MADDEDVQASSNSSHSGPNQKRTDSVAKDEKEELDQIAPRAMTTIHDEDVQAPYSSLHSSPNQKRTVALDPRHNDSKVACTHKTVDLPSSATIDHVSKRLLSKLSQRPSIDVAMARGILLFRVD
eukprot:288769_1